MSADSELAEAVAYLSRVAEPGSLALFEMVTERGYVEAARDIRAGHAPSDVLRATEARRTTIDPHADLDAAQRNGITLIYPEHPLWPHLALAGLYALGRRFTLTGRGRRCATPTPPSAIADSEGARATEYVPPLALWIKGLVSADGGIDDLAVRSTAIVGSRAATAYGTHLASELAYGLAVRGVTVVSGGAFGIDAAAHRGALAADGTTILVSAAGLDRAYPAANGALYEQIAATGLLVSERPPGSAPHRHRFLSRNRLIAALGAATVVVEAARRSGALNTARFARDQGRPVLAVPGPVTSAMSVGCHDLIRRDSNPATLVTSVSDVIPYCGSLSAESTSATSSSASGGAVIDPFDLLDQAARRVFDGFPVRGVVNSDSLSQLSGQHPEVVTTAIPRLLEAGLIERRPGGYERSAGVAS